MDAISLVLAVLAAGLLLNAARRVVHFNRRMRELWDLLAARERAHRVRELRDEPWTNLPATRYLYDGVDFEDPEIRQLKLTLKHLHRSAIASLLLFVAAAVATVVVWEQGRGRSDEATRFEPILGVASVQPAKYRSAVRMTSARTRNSVTKIPTPSRVRDARVDLLTAHRGR